MTLFFDIADLGTDICRQRHDRMVECLSSIYRSRLFFQPHQALTSGPARQLIRHRAFDLDGVLVMEIIILTFFGADQYLVKESYDAQMPMTQHTNR